ncbi:hypothetical protein CS063_13450 [Sporanaerobium hydrogeniformans]|uniref:Uncharacterized protein n=1 Tax=Sporanaerobium hydrogeniformans TaxID=3072179 RepID=A0AC61D9D5_9FIRM|nr:ComF family protein [Sporanaerobium hydrogeniformans]PHV69839.1 hypothetical protein CS063_13450 [Sporanaerobium hydrogeniformans]
MYALTQLLFPTKCTLCETILENEEESTLCSRCYPLVLREHVCKRCGRPYALDACHCAYCSKEDLEEKPPIRALFLYDGVARQAVLRWKYKGLRKYARDYAELFVHDLGWFVDKEIDALIPVPLAPHRLRKRGFNQALDLCKELSKLTTIPTKDILRRIKNTKPQSDCDREERLKQLYKSMAINSQNDVLGLRNIVLVDDIYTTGTTIKECVRALTDKKDNNIEKIYVLIVCIGV